MWWYRVNVFQTCSILHREVCPIPVNCQQFMMYLLPLLSGGRFFSRIFPLLTFNLRISKEPVLVYMDIDLGLYWTWLFSQKESLPRLLLDLISCRGSAQPILSRTVTGTGWFYWGLPAYRRGMVSLKVRGEIWVWHVLARGHLGYLVTQL